MPLSQHYVRQETTGKDGVEFNKAVGNMLQQARMSANMTQEQVGAELAISQDIISRHEKGSSISAFRLRQFARLYEKPVSFFYMADIAPSKPAPQV